MGIMNNHLRITDKSSLTLSQRMGFFFLGSFFSVHTHHLNKSTDTLSKMENTCYSDDGYEAKIINECTKR